MEDYINESAEMQEVAEPATDVEESAETQEVAEPVSEEETHEESHEEPSDSRTDADARFAEMRRQNEAFQRENQLMRQALSRFFDGETAEDLSINANAYAEQRDPEEYRAEYERDLEYETLRNENASLQEQLLNAQVDQLMREGLREVQSIDPNVKSLDELGDSFANFIKAGLSTKEAFYATKAMELKEKVYAPDAIGKVADTKAERDYYTSEELDNLTDEEMNANWDKVMRSMGRL